MISAVRELAENVHVGDRHQRVAEYLEACNRLFEEGILSHSIVSSSEQKVLVNMKIGFEFFSALERIEWKISRCVLEIEIFSCIIYLSLYIYMCM